MVEGMAKRVRPLPSAPPQQQTRAADAFQTTLSHLAAKRATAVSLTDLYRFGLEPSPDQCLRNAQFIYHELPIRVAQRVADLKALPFGLSEHPLVRDGIRHYENTVYGLVTTPKPNTVEAEHEYACLTASLLTNHRTIPMAIARAIYELRTARQLSSAEQALLNRRLDDFFMARISMRFLIEHYIASHACHPGFSGVIATECCPLEIVTQARADVEAMAVRQLGVCPAIEVLGNPKRAFRYVPSHLYFIASELLKNSVRATVESAAAAGTPSHKLPPVRAILVCGGEDDAFESVSIKIEDQGMGIKRSDMDKVFSYTYTTAPHPENAVFPNATASLSKAGDMRQEKSDPMAGLGIGLPLSRLYSRYFGGDLEIISMEKYGTDAYLMLPHFGDDVEILPDPIAQSPSQQGSCPKGAQYKA
uniref:Protein-serine/threonine kinase n=1 Tax=Phaeomonas parva TaxID=124430 RepID=A0A6U4IZ81_9STRA|mmetsp:Transcript_42089/g.131794  ORF Transcript_42089/g.131794 Transcript_42089/m.131794 type:complete len:419 (+) Transcript_42089:433-1689(+)